MKLFYRIAADAVVFVHFGYVAFVVLGLLIILVGIALRRDWVRNLTFRLLHLAAIGLVVVESWWGVTCPLTTLEQKLRNLAGETSYTGSFIGTLVHNLLFYEAPEWVFTICYTLFGLLVLMTFVFSPPRRPKWLTRNVTLPH